MSKSKKRLVVVSNRLPVVLSREGEHWRLRAASGGLVTALAPILKSESGVWVGWPGTQENREVETVVRQASAHTGYELEPVFLTAEEQSGFYVGFCNEIIWPLFHDMQSRCNFDPSYWNSYLAVNRKYAEAITPRCRPGDFLWVHDYHLMDVARNLRELGSRTRAGFFLHITFPSPDIFEKLPWRSQVLRALLEFDLVGFQTKRDLRNFLHCLHSLLPEARIHRRGRLLRVLCGKRDTLAGSFPISIDFEDFESRASHPEVAKRAQQIDGDIGDSQLVLGVDRMDYTKGIPERLKAFRNLLERNPEMHRRVVLVQVTVPSRNDVPRYGELKREIEQLVSQINGQFTQSGWVPVHYLYRGLGRRELMAYYRSASVALVTPLKDGMNLVAKEYCAANLEENGVLVLSEFAGAAWELERSALQVNPYDVVGTADTLRQALLMKEAERRRRMRKLRQVVRRADIYDWARSYLEALREPGSKRP